MAMPAMKLDWERPVEERVARLEANVEHIRSDISEMKTDIRGIRGEMKDIRGEMKEMDLRLSAKIDSSNQQMITRTDNLKDAMTTLALTMEKGFASLRVSRMADRVWWLLMSAGLLAVIGRAFKWI